MTETACKEFTYGGEGTGLWFTISVTTNGDGSLSATVEMKEGSMDLNALWFSDGDATGGEFGSTALGKGDNALNMNGATYDVGGDGTQDTLKWDGVQKLSNAGLGPEGENKSTFFTAGETQTITLNFTGSLDDLNYIGVRATSVNGGDSIKLIDEGVCPPPPPEENHFPEWAEPDISHVTFYFDTPDGLKDPDGKLLDVKGIVGEKGANDPDGWFTVKFDVKDDAGNEVNDLDNWYEEALEIIYDQYGDLSGYLKGVAIKGGQEEIWYDFDNDPDDVDTAPGVFPVQNKEVDVDGLFVTTDNTTPATDDFLFF